MAINTGPTLKHRADMNIMALCDWRTAKNVTAQSVFQSKSELWFTLNMLSLQILVSHERSFQMLSHDIYIITIAQIVLSQIMRTTCRFLHKDAKMQNIKLHEQCYLHFNIHKPNSFISFLM